MRHDRERGRKGTRNNWLLIKHRDGYEIEGEMAITDEDRSVASGRTMEQIAAGSGARPKPFMLAGKSAAANAVWHSNRGAKAPALAVARGAAPHKRETASRMPHFIEPQLCKRVGRPPTGRDWVHEIKLDGYRIQMRVADGIAVMRTRKGLDWTSDFASIAEAAGGLDDCILDGEVVALDHNGALDFAALQAALSEDRSSELTYFVFDLLYLNGVDWRRRSLVERKRCLQDLLEKKTRPQRGSSLSTICRSLATPFWNQLAG